MNIKYIQVLLFEISYKKTFSPYDFFLDVPIYLYVCVCVCVCVLCLETENIELNNANKDPQKSTGKPSPLLVLCFPFQ